MNNLTKTAVFGVGLIRQLLPTFDLMSCSERMAIRPLMDWSDLLYEVASMDGLLNAFNLELSKDMPTLQWDELVRAKVAQSPNRIQASEAEKNFLKLF